MNTGLLRTLVEVGGNQETVRRKGEKVVQLRGSSKQASPAAIPASEDDFPVAGEP